MNIVNEYGIIGMYYICVNIIAFILYGLDKKYAREGRWRIPEKTLLGIAMIGQQVPGSGCRHSGTRQSTCHFGRWCRCLQWCMCG